MNRNARGILMVKKAGTPTRFSNYITDKLMKSSRSQREIAELVGYNNQNMITMLKQGHVKLALDRVPDMAKALGIDQVDLFKIALTQFYDDSAVKILMDIVESGISKEERAILAVIRDAAGTETPVLTEKRESALRELFKPTD